MALRWRRLRLAMGCAIGALLAPGVASGQFVRVDTASDATPGNRAPGPSVAISLDGRYVVFASAATNLVAGDTNGSADVFVKDRQTGATTRASVATDGIEHTGDSGLGGISISPRRAVHRVRVGVADADDRAAAECVPGERDVVRRWLASRSDGGPHGEA